MIKLHLAFQLPSPWSQQTFETDTVGAINYLVGPNGSGKSRFAGVLKSQLPRARLLSTDRLNGMESDGGMRAIIGDHFPSGYPKNQFPQYKNIGNQFGSGLDSLVILDERLDLRIQVEATLSHLFNRQIALTWDSGSLVAKATLGATGLAYRLDRDECHGIKELLVLLTHLYNDEHDYLIIDEPELNLHPQYQAFFLQEVRKVAGDPRSDKSKKIVFLITHSPFMLDFKSIDDVKAIISFDLLHSKPKYIFGLDDETSARLSSLIPRLNVHHKQLFFADCPIFVEGVLDAQIIETMQNARGVSVAGAGSCIIDVGGNEEVNQYLSLCTAFGKNAYFVYDLDSLFFGKLRNCVGSDGTIRDFLADAGIGSDFVKYCGELDRELTAVIEKLLLDISTTDPVATLVAYLKGFGDRTGWRKPELARARVAVLTALSRYPKELESVITAQQIAVLEGRLNQIVAALRQRNIFLLLGGTIERYLPAYVGNPYAIADETKRTAVNLETNWMSEPRSESALKERYGDLYTIVTALPSKKSVDIEVVLKDYLANYIHDLQGAVTRFPTWGLHQVRAYLGKSQVGAVKLFSVHSFTRIGVSEFTAVILVEAIHGNSARQVIISQQTNAGTRQFRFDSAENL